MTTGASPALDRLIESLRCLPGVGLKTAQRMAMHLLERDRRGAARLVEDLAQALDRIGRCEMCRNLSESDTCRLCLASDRDDELVCAVEGPMDVMAIEQATGYRGRYFVLMGKLSPLDGIGPEELRLDDLSRRLANGRVRELIVATNPTVEGEATAHYLARLASKAGVAASRIAHGVPLGGDLEYVDSGTLAHAFSGRQTIPTPQTTQE